MFRHLLMMVERCLALVLHANIHRVLGNSWKISNIKISIFISYHEIKPLYNRYGCNSTKWSINLTINGNKEIKKISQNFLNHTRLWVIRNRDIFIAINHLVIILLLPTTTYTWCTEHMCTHILHIHAHRHMYTHTPQWVSIRML